MTGDSMKLSVIVPIFNVKKYLRECLDSILRQSYREYELILVDDGSTDISGSICDEYAASDERINVIHKPNEGLVNARKTGLASATGQYIICVDSDDWIEQGMFERFVGLMDSEDVDLVLAARYKDTGDSGRKILQAFPEGRYDRDRIRGEILPHMIMNDVFFRWGISPNMWDRVFKRDLLVKCQMDVDESLTMGEDAACTYPYILDCNSLYIAHDAYYHYRQTTTSMTSTSGDAELERERFRTLYHSVKKLLARRNCKDGLLRQWLGYVLFLSVPRADIIYDGFQDLDYLYPFSGVHKGDTIVIYGAGEYGQRLYRFNDRTGFCKVAALVDRNFLELSKQGIPVVSPEEMSDLEFDSIVLAISFYDVRTLLLNELSKTNPGVPIYGMDEVLVFSDESLNRFGYYGS